MRPSHTITGIHHEAVHGLGLVTLTINFDDPGTYRLYFGNDEDAPGSILTF